MNQGQYAVVWYDEHFKVVEWDIIPEGRLENDPRLTPKIGYTFGKNGKDDYEDIDKHGMRGTEAHEDARYIGTAGPFANAVYAQRYIDGNILAYQNED